MAFINSPEGCEIQNTVNSPYRSVRVRLRAAGRRPGAGHGRAEVPGRRQVVARRWSSSPRSRARTWRRSPSRSAPASSRPRRAPSCTTTTSRSRPSSWVSPAGDRPAVTGSPLVTASCCAGGRPLRPVARPRVRSSPPVFPAHPVSFLTPDQRRPDGVNDLRYRHHRRLAQAGAQTEAAQPLSPVVLPAGRDHLRRPVRDPDLRLVLLLPHPLDLVRHRVHRAGQLQDSSSPSRPCGDR